jgi:fibronectin-binding autotransporter adhesin
MRQFWGILLGVGIAVSSFSAWAVNATWNGTTDALWSTTTNWSASPVPATGNTATFNNAGNARTTIDLGSGVTIATLLFDTANAAAYTIGSGGAGAQTLTLNDSGAVTMNATVVNNQRIDANVLLGTAITGTYTLTNNSLTNSLTFGGTIQGGTGGTGAAKTLTVTGAGNTTISGAIGNGGSTALALNKTGAGVLVLGSANTFTGATSVDRGTNGLASGVIRANANNVFSSTAALNMLGGTVDLNGFNATVGSIWLGKDATQQYGNTNLITTGSGTLTLGGNVTMDSDNRAAGNIIAGNLNLGGVTRTFTNNTDLASGGTRQVTSITVSANVSGDTGVGITTAYSNSSVAAAFTLSGNNTYNGTTSIGGGYVRAGSATALGSGGNITFAAANATLQYTAASAGTDWSSRFKSNSQAVRLDTNSQAVTLGTIDNTNSGGLVKLGAGTLVLSAANTFTGGVTVNEGTLKLDKNANAAAAIVATNALTLGGGTFLLAGASVGTTAQTLGNLTINSGNSAIVVDSSTGSGATLTLGNTWTRAAGGTLLVDLSSGSGFLSSTAGLASGSQSPTQAILGYATVKDQFGTGFATNVSGSVVRYQGAATLAATSTSATTNYRTAPSGSSTAGSPYLALNTGLVAPSYNSLEVDTSAAAGSNALDLSGSVVTLTQGGLLTSGSGAFTIQNGQLGASGSELMVHQNGPGTLTINALVGAGAASLTKDGAGTLILPAASFYTGATTINGGVVSMRNANALGTSAGTITVNNNAALQLEGGVLTQAKTLGLNGSGIANDGALRSISGYNVYTGEIRPGMAAGGTSTTGSLATRINADSGTLLLSGIVGSTTVVNAGDLVVGGAGDTWISGAINTLSGSLTKDGAGLLTLSGANVFTGGMNINAGTVTALVAQTLGSTNAGPFGRSGPISFGGGTLRYSQANQTDYSWRFSTADSQPIKIDTNNQAVSFATALTGAGTSLTKSGFGTLTLSAAPTYTGGTTVSAGTLLLSGAINMPSTGGIAVGSGGTFSLADGTARTTTSAASLALSGGATLAFDWNAAARDTLTSTAAVTASGPIAIQLNNTSPTGSGGTLLSSPSGGLTSGGAAYYLANNTNYTATLTANDNALTIGAQTAGTALTNAYWVGNRITAGSASGVDNAMALSNGAASNWSSAAAFTATGLVPGSAANLFFSATSGVTPSQQSNVVLGSSMNVNSLTFNDATPVTIAADGSSLRLNSTGTGASSAISTNQSATINAGVLLGANQTWTTAAGRTLSVGGTIGEVGGTYTLTLAGAAGSTVNLSGVSSYSNATTVSGGTVNYTSTASKQYLGTNSNLTVSGGVVNVNGMVDVNTLSLNGTNTGALNVNSGGTLVLRGNPTLSNYLNVAAGGTLVALGTMPVNGGSAVLRVSGGTLTMGNQVLGVNGGSGGELTITSGVINHGAGTAAFNIGNGSGVGGTGVVNVVGGLLDNTGAGIYAAEGNGGNPGVVAILNVNGGLLISNDILRSSQGNQRPGYGAVNFGGGTVKASAASTSYFSPDGLGAGSQPNNNGTEVRKVYVNAGGGTFDTNFFNVTIPAVLQAPAGNGVSTAITVGSAGSGYIGAPLVTIADAGVSATGSTSYTSYQITGLSSTAGIVVGQEVTGLSLGGGTGSRAYVTSINGNTVTLSNWIATTGSVTATFKGAGATAFATVGGGGITGITLTNPGVGYATPSISLSGGLDTGGTAASGFGLTTTVNVSGGFTKSGPGTLTFSNFNTYGTSIAGTTVSGGTLQMSIGGSRLATVTAPLAVNAGGVFDLNGTSQTVGNFGGTGGVVWNSAVGTAAVLAVGNGNGSGGTFAGVITNNSTGAATGGGTLALVKTGSGTIGLSGLSTFTGGTTVSGGTLLVDFVANPTDILPAAGGVTLGGGTLALKGAAGLVNSQSLTGLSLARGASAIAPDFNGASSLTLNLNGISRGVGSTLDVTGASLFGGANITTSSGTPGQIFLANGVAYATVGGADWAAKDNIFSTSIIGLADVGGYTASTPTELSGNVDVSSGVDTTLGAHATVTSLRFAAAEQRAIFVGGNTLTTGGVLVTPNSQASQISGGTLRGPAGADLVVIQNSGQSFTIGSVIADNASATGLTKSGSGTLVLTGANTFTGVASVNAGTLTLQNSDALPNTVATVVAAGATLGLGVNETIGSLAGAGTVSLGSNVLTTGNDGSSTVFSGTIGGTGGIAKVGGGTFTLSGSNTYTGATTISGGTLRGGSAGSLGVNSAVTLANTAGATFDLGGAATSIGSLTGGGASGGTVALGNARLTIGADGTSPAAFAGRITGSSVGGSLTKAGGGTLILSGTNSYRGDTTISAGTLQTGSSTALAPYAAVVLANTAGATLDLAGFDNTVGSLTGGGATGGNVVLGSGTLTIGSDNQTRAAYAGVISGAGSIRKIGSGTLTLTAGNTLAGTTYVNQGTLTLSGSSATFGSTSVGVSMGGGTLDLGGLTRTVGTVSIASSATAGSTIQNGTLVAASYAASNTYGNAPLMATVSAALQGVGATVAKSGGGILELSGTNTYDGSTTISAGGIRASSAAALGATTVGTEVASGAALQVNATLNAEPISISGTGFAGDGAIRGLGTFSVTGPVTLAAASRINSDSATLTLSNALGGTGDLTIGSIGAATVTVSGAIGSTGALTKDGAGTLNLSGANTFSGQTTLLGGTLTLDYGTQNNSKLADAAVLSVGNGTLTITNGSHTEAVASTTFTSGATSITRPGGTSVLQLNALTRNVGATANFGAASIATADTPNDATGILGGWAVLNNADWAQTAASAADTAITAFTGYATQNAAGSWAAGQHITNSGAISGTTASGLSIASLRFNAANAGTVTIGDTLTVSTGGILQTSTVAANLQTITGGTLRGAAGADLVVHQGAATNTLTVASTIANNGSATALTKAGAGTLTLTNSGNTYNGGTVLNAGSLTAQAATQSTTQSNNVLGSGPLLLNGGTLNLRDNGDGVAAAQTINYGLNTTLNGAATVTVDRVATSTTKTIQLGTLTLNNNPSLTVTNTNSYGLRFGAATLAGNATFVPSGAGNVSTGVPAGLAIDTIDFGNAPRALVMSGAGELRVGLTGAATNVAANTNWTVTAGTLTAVAGGALGGANDTIVLNGGGLQLLSDGIGAGLGNGAVETITHGDNVLFASAAGTRTITAGKLGAAGNAANKRFQLGSLVIPNNSQLTYNLNNGSSLEFTGPVTLGSAGGAASNKVTFLGGTAGSNAPINQGLILSGVVQGGGFWVGTGFVQLTNPNNTFSSAEWIINGMGNGSPQPGILSFTNSGAMGAASNVYAIGQVTQGSPTLQFDGTFSVVHQIAFGSTSNNNGILDVTQGNVATMAMPFNGGAFNAQGFSKTGNGVLAIAVDNNNNGAGNWWNGPVTVSAGAIRVLHEGALGSTALVASTQTIGNTVVSGVGAAVQFDASLSSGAMTVAEPFSITGSGLNTGGALQTMSGTTTLSGAIALTGASTIGADAGSTLTIASQISGAQALTVAGAGNVTLGAGVAANVSSLTKIGSGTLTVAADNSGNTNTITINAGTLAVSGAGRINGNVSITPGATLSLDYSGVTASNIFASARTLTLSGGTVSVKGNPTGTTSQTITPDLAYSVGSSRILVDANGGSGTTLSLANLGTSSYATGVTLLLGRPSGAGSGTAMITAAGVPFGRTLYTSDGGTNVDFVGSSSGAAPYTLGATSYATLPASGAGSSTIYRLTGGITMAASQTVRNLKVEATGAGQSLALGGTTLTVNSNGLLFTGSNAYTVTGSAATGLTSGNLNTNGQDLIVHQYNTGGVTVSAVIGDNGGTAVGLTKSGPGSLTLTAANTYTGATYVNEGTLTLAAGHNTLAGNKALVVNGGGRLSLGANNQYVGALSSTGTVEGAGGVINGSGVLTTNAASGTFAGSLQGTVGLTKAGANTLTLSAASSTAGVVNVIGGGLTLSDGGALPAITGLNVRGATLTLGNTGTKDVADRINNAAAVTLDGGTLIYNGRAQANSVESIGAVTATSGANIINAVAGGTNVNSAQLTIASLSRSTGAELFLNQNQATNFGIIGNGQRIVVTSGLSGNLTPVNGVVPGAYTSTNTDTYYMVGYVPGLGFGPVGAGTAGFPSTTSNFSTAGPTDNVYDPASAAVAANKTINSMRQATLTFTNGTAAGGPDLLTIGSGMTIVQNSTWGTATQRGRVTSGTSELFIMHRDGNASPDPTIHSVITDNGSPVSLVVHTPRQDRGYYVHLTAPNTYSGGTYVHGGPGVGGISLDATSAGIVTIPAGGLVINNNGLVDMTGFEGQIAASNVVTINGGGALGLMGTNVLAGIVFNSNGGTAQPKVTPYITITAGTSNALATYGAKTGTLVLTGHITSNPSNVAVTPLLDSGFLDLNNSAAHDITVGALAEGNYVNGVGALNGLQISSTIQNGGFTKKGAGVLNLTGTNTFANQLTIENGVVNVATLTNGGTAGPLGAGSQAVVMGGSGGTTGTVEYTGGNVSVNKAFQMATGGAGAIQVDTAATTLTLSSALDGSGNFIKSGAGSLTLTNAQHSLNGRTIVSAGTLTLSNATTSNPLTDGLFNLSTFIDVQRGGTLSVSGLQNGTLTLAGPLASVFGGTGQTIGGNGTIVGGVTIAQDTTLSPGASPGLLSQTGNQTWATGGNYNWQVYDAAGTAGTGFDQMSITGTLTIESGFNVNLWSLAGIGPDVNGDAINFNAGQDSFWVIATASSGLVNAANLSSANVFTTANNGTNGFTNSLSGGTFALMQGDGVRGTLNDVVLTYTSMIIPEPDTLALAGAGAVLAAWAARRARRRA